MLSDFGIAPSTGELQPPYPNWEEWQIQTIDEAIADAWNRVLQDAELPSGWMLTANEEAITERVHAALCRLLQDGTIILGFSKDHFQDPHREASTTSHDGKQIKISPDLFFKRAAEKFTFSDPRQFGYFVECKIVDANHSVAKYCDDGVARFCEGKYAWAMQFAGMVAYIRVPPNPPLQPHSSLSKALNGKSKSARRNSGVIQGPARCSFSKTALGVEVTVHNRISNLPPITLRHIWLNI